MPNPEHEPGNYFSNFGTWAGERVAKLEFGMYIKTEDVSAAVPPSTWT
jgi:hypothetical protein